jgi:uncharacterized protein
MGTMELRRFDNILAIKADGSNDSSESQLVGFHAHNLQVAEISTNAWQALNPGSLSGDASEERQELELWNREIDPGVFDADIEQAPRHYLVNIAQICNLKCDYCAAGGDGTFGEAMKSIELDTIYEQIAMLLHDIPNGGDFTMTFFGGEPLLAFQNIRHLVRYVKLHTAGRNIDVFYRLITNGTLLTPEIAEYLASISCHVTISIDGPPEINDLARKTKAGKGSTALALRGLETLQPVRSRLGSLAVSAVFGKHHTNVVKAYEFLREFGFDYLKFDFAAETDDGGASRQYAEQLCRTADLAYALGGEKELRRIGFFDGAFRTLDQQRRLYNYCGAGKSLLTADGKGRIAACQWFLGKPSEQLGKGTEIDRDRLAEYSSRLTELHNCQQCWARHLCGGGCMYVNQVKSGSKHKKDQEFCNRTRTTFAKAIEYYAKARKSVTEGDRSETY